MLPLQQALEVRDSIIEYIKATFKFKEKDVSDPYWPTLVHLQRTQYGNLSTGSDEVDWSQ